MIKFEGTGKDVCTALLTVDALVNFHRGSTFYGSCGGNGHEGYWYVFWGGVVSLDDSSMFFSKDFLGEEIVSINRFCNLSIREVE